MSSRFQRFLLPGFAFKAVVIGGGYATGRELAEFFMPSGPWGGVAAMLLATVIWAAVCVATFLFARRYGALDYQTFVRALLGPASIVFEVAYLLFVVLILAVFGAAAGAIGKATLGAPEIVGTSGTDGSDRIRCRIRHCIGGAPLQVRLVPVVWRVRTVRDPVVHPFRRQDSWLALASPRPWMAGQWVA